MIWGVSSQGLVDGQPWARSFLGSAILIGLIARLGEKTADRQFFVDGAGICWVWQLVVPGWRAASW